MPIEQIAITAVVALVGLSLVTILLFGVRSFMNGKIDPLKTVFIGFPFVLFAVLGFAIVPSWSEAGVWTLVVMIFITILAMFYTSIRGVFR